MTTKKHDSNLILTKTQVAERQLNTAVDLFFKSGDPVSVHTLTSAVHEILEVLTRGDRGFEIFLEASCIRPEKKSEVIDLFKKAQNFFKHAGKEASKAIEFVPFQTEIMLFDCVRMYMRLTNQKSPEVHVYQLWFIMRYPQYFNYTRNPKDPLFKMYATARASGLDPEKNLKAFGDSIPALKQSGMFPVMLPKGHKAQVL